MNALPKSCHAGQYSCTCPACNGEGVVWMDYPEVARKKVAQANEKIAAKPNGRCEHHCLCLRDANVPQTLDKDLDKEKAYQKQIHDAAFGISYIYEDAGCPDCDISWHELAPALPCESLDKLAAALLAFDSRFAVKP